MFVLNKSRFLQALEEEGYDSIQELAASLGLHRNTIHHFLKGEQVLPKSIEKIIETLHLQPVEILTEQPSPLDTPLKGIAPIVDTLHAEFPHITFILFGSRARGKAKKYSDWDIGVFSQEGIPHQTYLNLRKQSHDLTEKQPYLVDLVNLNQADELFLKNASRNWQFLTGKLQDWLTLQKKVQKGASKNERTNA